MKPTAPAPLSAQLSDGRKGMQSPQANSQIELLTMIANALQPLREIAMAQRESVELQREVASSLRRLESQGRVGPHAENNHVHYHPEEIHELDGDHEKTPGEIALPIHFFTALQQKMPATAKARKKSKRRNSLKAGELSASESEKPLVGSNSATPEDGAKSLTGTMALLSKSPSLTVGADSKLPSIEVQTAPHDVYCRFNVFNIDDIDLKHASVKMDFYFEATWEVPTLLRYDNGQAVLAKTSEVDWEKMWKPEVSFANKDGQLHINSWNAVDASYYDKFGVPMASWRAKVSGQFYQKWDLRLFPYDTQTIYIKATSDQKETVCNLLPNNIVPSAAAVNRFSIAEQFDVKFEPDKAVVKLDARQGAGGKYSELTASVYAHRRPKFVLVNYVFMVYLIVIGFLVSMYPIALDGIDNRLEIGAGFVLTAVALKLLSADRLPDLAYLTSLDRYLLGSIGLIIGLLFLFVLFFTVVKDATILDYLDKSLILGCAFFWTVGHFPVFHKLMT